MNPSGKNIEALANQLRERKLKYKKFLHGTEDFIPPDWGEGSVLRDDKEIRVTYPLWE